MEFAGILAQVIDLLAVKNASSYRALKLRFHLDDEYLEGLKEEMIYAKRLAVDEEGESSSGQAMQERCHSLSHPLPRQHHSCPACLPAPGHIRRDCPAPA